MVVLIDAGHGIGCPNASPDKKLVEWQFSRDMAERLHDALDALGIQSLRVIEGDNNAPLKERAEVANALVRIWGKKNCALVSLHADALGDGAHWYTARGASVRVSLNASTRSKILATNVTTNLEATGIYVRKPLPAQAYWEQNLAICRDTICPAILVECGFMTSQGDCEKLLRDDYRDKIAKSIAQALLEYYQETCDL